MKIICLLFALGVLLKNVVADSAPSNKVQTFIQDRCRKYSLEASDYDTLKKHLDEFLDYLQYTAALLPKGKQGFCDDERSTLKDLMRALSHDLKPCFPKDEKYLPKFLYESFVEFLDFLCDRDGKNIDNFFSTQGRDCMNILKQEQGGEEVTHCFRKIFAPQSGIVKKGELCDALTTGKKCFGIALAKHCADFRAFNKLNSDFFNAIMKPCSTAAAGTSAGISSLVFTLLALFSTKVIS